MRTLYVKPGLVKSLPRDCRLVNVSPLLNELILHICGCGALRTRVGWQRHPLDVIFDQLRAIQYGAPATCGSFRSESAARRRGTDG